MLQLKNNVLNIFISQCNKFRIYNKNCFQYTHSMYFLNDSPSRGSLPDAEKRGNGSASSILTKVIITRVSQIRTKLLRFEGSSAGT